MKASIFMRKLLPTRPRRAYAGAVAALALTVGLVVAPGQAATAVATTELFTGADFEAVASTIVADDFGSGAASAVVSQNNEASVLLAANYAARHDLPVVVAESGSDATDVLAQLSTLGASSVVKVSSSPGWFTSSWDGDLASASVSIGSEIDDADLFTRWSGAAYSPSADEFVVARTDQPTSVNLAAAYAGNHGLPLVLWETTTSAVDLEAFFELVGGTRITHFGSDESAPPIPDDHTETVQHINPPDATQQAVTVAMAAEARASRITRIVVAPSNSAAEVALAALHARQTSSIAVPAGTKSALLTSSPAAELLKLFGTETVHVDLVGVGTTTTELNSLAALTGVARDAAPAFRVTNVTKGTSTYSVQLTAVAGATKYRAYGLDGTLIGNSTTTTLTFSSQPSALLLTAENSSGPLKQTNFRLNEYLVAADRESAVVSTTDAGDNHLLFLSALETPRLITRTMSDPFSGDETEYEDVALAITCASTFSDTGLDATKQYSYSVIELANVSSYSCDPTNTPTQGTAAPTIVAEIPVPPTEFPWEARGETVLAAAPTQMDMLLAAAAVGSSDLIDGASIEAQQDAAGPGADAARGPGDDWMPIKAIWTAYIPEAKFPMAAYGDGPGIGPYPWLVAGGDGHGTYQPLGSARFRQTVLFEFGSDHDVQYGEFMGESHLWQCADPTGQVCINHDSATAPYSQLNSNQLISTAVSGSAHVWSDAQMPLIPGSPGITTDWKIKLSSGGSSIRGTHDNMPQHEFYIGIYPGHAYREYRGTYYGANVRGLTCLFAPQMVLPGCQTSFNVQL